MNFDVLGQFLLISMQLIMLRYWCSEQCNKYPPWDRTVNVLDQYNHKNKLLVKEWRIISLKFFNPCGETMEKHKMYAEFFCDTLVTTNNKK